MSGLTFEGTQWRAIKLLLLLASALIASMGLGGTPRTEAHATGLQHPAQVVTISHNAWSDDFQDASGLSGLDGVQVSAGQLRLASDTYLGSATSVPISPTAEVQSWGHLVLTCTVPLSTGLRVDVLDGADGTPLMHNVPSGGSLAGIDAGLHPTLKLRATLTATLAGSTPSLDAWRVTWSPVYSQHVFLPAIGNFLHGSQPQPPRLGAAIAFVGASDQSPTGQEVHFASLRQNDGGWDSSFAVQNITSFATTLTLKFFRADGTPASVSDGIPLRPHGTYIARMADFPSLAGGTYALAATATEAIAGVASTQHAAGKMATAYSGTSQGGRQIFAPLIYKGYGGWTSRLCVHNMTPEAAGVQITYRQQQGNIAGSRQVAIPGNGVYCVDLAQEPLVPPSFEGSVFIVTYDSDLVATVEDVNSQLNQAWAYSGFDPSAASDTVYVPRCQKAGIQQTRVLAVTAGSSASGLAVSYHDYTGSSGYDRTYPLSLTGFSCPESPWIDPPGPYQTRLGSAVVSVSQTKLIALAIDTNSPGETDPFDYPCPSIVSGVVYVSDAGGGRDAWASTLSIQSPNAVTNSITLSFYDRAGNVLADFHDILPPYGMTQYAVAQFPGLSAGYEGSAIISATSPVAVVVRKQR
jgi:hypothetical protein